MLNLNLNKCSINLSYENQTSFLGFLINRYQNKKNYFKSISKGIKIIVVNSVLINLALLLSIKKIF